MKPNAQSRYHIDEDGKEWFLVGESRWKLIETVEITDALACSRYELGWVYVTYGDDVDFYPEKLYAVDEYTYTTPTVAKTPVVVTNESLPDRPKYFRLCTLQELKDAGIE